MSTPFPKSFSHVFGSVFWDIAIEDYQPGRSPENTFFLVTVYFDEYSDHIGDKERNENDPPTEFSIRMPAKKLDELIYNYRSLPVKFKDFEWTDEGYKVSGFKRSTFTAWAKSVQEIWDSFKSISQKQRMVELGRLQDKVEARTGLGFFKRFLQLNGFLSQANTVDVEKRKVTLVFHPDFENGEIAFDNFNDNATKPFQQKYVISKKAFPRLFRNKNLLPPPAGFSTWKKWFKKNDREATGNYEVDIFLNSQITEKLMENSKKRQEKQIYDAKPWEMRPLFWKITRIEAIYITLTTAFSSVILNYIPTIYPSYTNQKATGENYQMYEIPGQNWDQTLNGLQEKWAQEEEQKKLEIEKEQQRKHEIERYYY